MRRRWFVPMGWIWRPVSVPGWAALAAAAIFCVQVVLAADRHSHSASDTLYGVFPYVVPCLLALDWLAGKTGRVEG